MKHLSHIPPLDYAVHADGSIDLEQSYSGNVDRISLHSCHVRHLFECAGHLLPSVPADDLSKRLAVQVCELRDGLALEIGRSPGIDALHLQATAATDMMPDTVYPHWLYESPADKEKQKPAPQPEFQLQPSPKEPA